MIGDRQHFGLCNLFIFLLNLKLHLLDFVEHLRRLSKWDLVWQLSDQQSTRHQKGSQCITRLQPNQLMPHWSISAIVLKTCGTKLDNICRTGHQYSWGSSEVCVSSSFMGMFCECCSISINSQRGRCSQWVSHVFCCLKIKVLEIQRVHCGAWKIPERDTSWCHASADPMWPGGVLHKDWFVYCISLCLFSFMFFLCFPASCSLKERRQV